MLQFINYVYFPLISLSIYPFLSTIIVAVAVSVICVTFFDSELWAAAWITLCGCVVVDWLSQCCFKVTVPAVLYAF